MIDPTQRSVLMLASIAVSLVLIFMVWKQTQATQRDVEGLKKFSVGMTRLMSDSNPPAPPASADAPADTTTCSVEAVMPRLDTVAESEEKDDN